MKVHVLHKHPWALGGGLCNPPHAEVFKNIQPSRTHFHWQHFHPWAVSKGVSSSFPLNKLLRCLSSIQLIGNIALVPYWITSALNPSDEHFWLTKRHGMSYFTTVYSGRSEEHKPASWNLENPSTFSVYRDAKLQFFTWLGSKTVIYLSLQYIYKLRHIPLWKLSKTGTVVIRSQRHVRAGFFSSLSGRNNFSIPSGDCRMLSPPPSS